MNPKTTPTHYSIEAIVRSIVTDNPRAKSLTAEKKRVVYNEGLERLKNAPGLKELLTLSHVRNYAIDGSENFARIGVLPPELVIVDQRIKDMCALPHWTYLRDKDGNPQRFFGKCPGYDFLPACPPRSMAVGDVEKRLHRADLFVVLQTRLLSELGANWKFKTLRRLAKEIERALGKGAVTEHYGSGPCYACKTRACLQGLECANPKQSMCPLESLGIAVDTLCNDLADLTGQSAWRITWIKNFGAPTQTPKKWKYVMALGVKIPS